MLPRARPSLRVVDRHLHYSDSATTSGMVFVVEEFLPPVIGRPSASAAGVPAGVSVLDRRVMQYAIAQVSSRPVFKSESVAVLASPTMAHLNRRHGTDRGQKKTQDSAELGQPSGASATAGGLVSHDVPLSALTDTAPFDRSGTVCTDYAIRM